MPGRGRVARIAAGTRGTVERSAYYQLLGFAKDDGLARRALDLSITKEPGATRFSAPRSSPLRPKIHPVMAFDFVLSHLPQVDPLIDLSASSRFVSRLVQNSGDAAVVPKLQAYAAANLRAEDRLDRASRGAHSLEGRISAARPQRSHRLAKKPLGYEPLRPSGRGRHSFARARGERGAPLRWRRSWRPLVRCVHVSENIRSTACSLRLPSPNSACAHRLPHCECLPLLEKLWGDLK